jgi:hypothetical protein
MSFPKYPAYKPSGVEGWRNTSVLIGDIYFSALPQESR